MAIKITKDSKWLSTKLTNGEESGCLINTSMVSRNSYKGNKDLEKVEIPNGITTIGEGAFENCLALTTVVIPESVITIELNAFYGSESLKLIIVSGELEEVDCWFDGRGVAKQTLFEPSSEELIENLKKGYRMDLHFKGNPRADHWD
jgi:hypothetical protein